MAHAKPTIQLILNLYKRGYFANFKSVIEIGSQDLNFQPRTNLFELIRGELSLDTNYLEHVFSEALRKSTPDDFSPDWLFKLLGFQEYYCVDADGRHDAFIWDLNVPIPVDQRGRYDLITNNGTSEHVFNISQIFKNIHDLAHAGSIMLHMLPFQGYIDHGFYNYQPSFFEDMAYENRYEIIEKFVIISKAEDAAESAQIIPYSKDTFVDIYKRDKDSDALLYYALRKQNNKDFRIPFQGIYDPLLLTNYRKSFSQKLSQKIAIFFFKGPNSFGRRIQKSVKEMLHLSE